MDLQAGSIEPCTHQHDAQIPLNFGYIILGRAWRPPRLRPGATALFAGLPAELLPAADQVAVVEVAVLLRELDAVVGAARLLPLEGEAGDQPRQRIGVLSEPLELVGAANGAGEAPNRVAG